MRLIAWGRRACAAATTLLAAASTILACGALDPGPEADRPPPVDDDTREILLRNARIFTAADDGEFASAIALTDGEITWVGDDAVAGDHTGPDTAVFDLGGRLVLPGLHDVHQHTLEARLEVIDCLLDPEVTNAEDHRRAMRRCEAHPDTGWVLGWGHRVGSLVDAERAPRLILDEVFPSTPAAFGEESSHSTWVNSAALAALGIDRDTVAPPGGIIVRDDDGEPNGILVDAAGELPWNLALARSEALDEANYAAVLLGLAANNGHGITSAVDARVYWRRGYVEAYERAQADDVLTVRMVLSLWAYPDADDDAQLSALAARYRDDGGMLRVSQIKVYADGLLQNTTAALLEPYLGDTWGYERGLSYFDLDRLTRYTRSLQAVGFDMHVHAIGDRGVRETLDAIEATHTDAGGDDAHHRLTHVELVHPDDVPRFAALGAFADMQLSEWTDPAHVQELGEFIGAERASERAWPVRDLHEAGATLVFSSDYDVGELSPFAGIERAVTRGDQSLPTVADAVRAYTINAARLMRSETATGSLEIGKRADLIVVDRDIFSVPETQIGDARVLWTLVDGRDVYRRAGFDPGS